MSAMSLLPVQLDGVWLAVAASSAREVLGGKTWVRVPGARPEVPGVVEWNGEAVAVVDLAVAVLARPSARTRRQQTVIVELGAVTFALPVDAVSSVEVVDDESLRTPTTGSPLFSSGEAEVSGGPAAVVDLEALVRSFTTQQAECAR